jgi:Prophage CP4-57 regulatory protein (AlpA)
MTVGDIAPDDLVCIDDACRELGGAGKPINRATLYRGMKDGRYPKPIKVEAQAVRWLMPELRAARARMIAARDAT